MSIERIRRNITQSNNMFNTNGVPRESSGASIDIQPVEYRSSDNSIICFLQGGMGNQMFQYALGKNLSLKYDVPLKLNISRFDLCGMRQYSLGLWSGVNEPIVNEKSIVIKENGIPYDESTFNSIVPGTSFVGYWQSEKYFFNIKKELQDIFLPKKELTERGSSTLKKILEAGDKSVFLTVRRSDYVNSNFHNVLSKDYYDKALSIVEQDVKDPVIFIFSDEPEWCKTNMKLPYKTIVSGNYDITTKTHLGREDEELFLMMNCKHAILANSSYSWWGAWLNKNPGIRVAPLKWFENDNGGSRDIVSSDWIRI